MTYQPILKSRKGIPGAQGIALISAVLLLAFLSIIGGALLAAATIDLAVAENYRSNAQLFFIAEAGLEAGREALRTDELALGDRLAGSAGADRRLASATDLATLLASDDRPLLPADPGARGSGHPFEGLGSYHVFLRNDSLDGTESTVEGNGVVALLSIARIGRRTRVVEAHVMRGAFGPLRSALTLAGSTEGVDLAGADLLHVDGRDPCGRPPVHSVGVLSTEDGLSLIGAIETGRESRYTGVDPFPDIADIAGDLPGSLKRPESLERIVFRIRQAATDLFVPPYGDEAALGDVGAPEDPRIVAVDGDVTFGPGEGHGLLLVRGELLLESDFTWHGLVLVIGQGSLAWNGGSGEIRGGLFVARTRDSPSAENPLGDLLEAGGAVRLDLAGAGGNGIFYDSCAIERAHEKLPYGPISIREY